MTTTPDGSRVAVLAVEQINFYWQNLSESIARDRSMRVWDVATGKRVARLERGVRRPVCLAFAQDGRSVVTGNEDGTLSLWELATGRERHTIPRGPAGHIFALAYAPDGRTLAGAGSSGVVSLWDAGTGDELPALTGHTQAVLCMAWGAEGQTLVTGGADRTVLVWDGPRRPERAPAVRLRAEEADALWAALADDDPRKAFAARRAFCRVPGEVVAVFRKRLQPAPVPAPKLLTSLIDDLASNEFAVRERATAELERLAELAEPALRQALRAGPNLEQERRLSRLLKQISSDHPPPDLVRGQRVLEILELIGTDEAQALVERLARGAEGARLTRLARESLKRLGG